MMKESIDAYKTLLKSYTLANHLKQLENRDACATVRAACAAAAAAA